MSIFKRFRDSVDWTQADLALAIGVQRSAVSNYESGKPPQRVIASRFVELANSRNFPTTLEIVYADYDESAA